MVQAILVIHLLTALIIIGLILMQQGKGAEAGASFGAGASQTIFGSAGSWNFFSRMTAIFATIFFITSIALAVVAKNSAVVEDHALPAAEEVDIPDSPAVPETPAVDESAEIPVLDEPVSSNVAEQPATAADAAVEEAVEEPVDGEIPDTGAESGNEVEGESPAAPVEATETEPQE